MERGIRLKKGIPMIFFHLGDSFYLQYTFNQILQSNPNSDVYLIGDEKNKHYERLGIHHVDMKTCEKTAKEFEKIYTHLSVMGGFVERICFERWMYMRDFVLNEGIAERFCCLDSDVLVYGDITEYSDSYCPDFDVTLHGKFGPGCNIFKNVSVLTKLVDNTFKYYSTPELLVQLRRIFIEKKQNVTDMTMIEAFVDECDITSYDLLTIVDGKTFDSHIGQITDDRFEKNGLFKKTCIENEKLYCFETTTQKKVDMLSLHIQGRYKMFIYRWYTGDKKKVDSKLVAIARMIYLKAKLTAYLIARKLKIKKNA